MTTGIVDLGANTQLQEQSEEAPAVSAVLCFPKNLNEVLTQGCYEGMSVVDPARVRRWLKEHHDRSDVSIALQMVGNRWLAAPVRLHAGQWWFIANDAWSESSTAGVFGLESPCLCSRAESVVEEV